MHTDGYQTLKVRTDDGIARATIDHPPINLFDGAMIVEMDRFSREAEADDDVRVVVVDSANPDFFIAHADVGLILQLPQEEQAKPTELPLFTAMIDRFRTMPKASIAVIEGRARGGGSELVLGMDMRFAARGRAVLAQPEVAVGIIPGGGGTQRLARVMGKQRAMELVLTGRRIEAKEALQLGIVNMVTPKKNWLEEAVGLAQVVARRPPLAARLAKQAVLAADEMTLAAGLAHERRLYELAMATEDRIEGMQAFIEKRRPTFRGR